METVTLALVQCKTLLNSSYANAKLISVTDHLYSNEATLKPIKVAAACTMSKDGGYVGLGGEVKVNTH
jgi:hypothetical protein